MILERPIEESDPTALPTPQVTIQLNCQIACNTCKRYVESKHRLVSEEARYATIDLISEMAANVQKQCTAEAKNRGFCRYVRPQDGRVLTLCAHCYAKAVDPR